MIPIILGFFVFGFVGFFAGAEWQQHRWNKGVGFWKDQHIKALQERVEFLQGSKLDCSTEATKKRIAAYQAANKRINEFTQASETLQ